MNFFITSPFLFFFLPFFKPLKIFFFFSCWLKRNKILLNNDLNYFVKTSYYSFSYRKFYINLIFFSPSLLPFFYKLIQIFLFNFFFIKNLCFVNFKLLNFFFNFFKKIDFFHVKYDITSTRLFLL